MNNIIKFASIFATILVLALFAISAVRGIINPVSASTVYGMPVKDEAGALFFRVYLSRNVVILIVALVFLLRQRWAALATLMTTSILLPFFDAVILKLQLGSAAPLAFHIGTAIALLVLSILLWFHVVNVGHDKHGLVR